MSTLTLTDALQQAITHHQSGQLPEAERLYRAILEKEPRHPEANHNLGVLAVQCKKTPIAVAHFKTALEENPSKGAFWLSYLNALIDVNQLELAKQVLAQGRKGQLQGPAVDQLEQRLRMLLVTAATGQEKALQPAITLREAGHYTEAESWLELWLLAHPEDATAYALYTHVLLLNKKEALAWDAIQKALSLQPSLPSVQRTLARLLVRKQQVAQALQSAQAAWQSDNQDPENQLVLAAILHAAGKADEAFPLLNTLVAHHPHYAEAYGTLALLKQQKGELAEALSDIDKALTLKPHMAQGWQFKSMVLSQLGRIDESAVSLEKFIAFEPDNIEALAALAQYKCIKKQFEEARKLLNHALNLNPSYLPALINLGALLQEQGQSFEAISIYHQILALHPDSPEVLCNLAGLLLEQGTLTEAALKLQKARILRPTSTEIYFNLAMTLFEDTQFEELAKLLTEGEGTFGHYPEYALLRCKFALTHNDWAEARRYLEECRTKAPNDPRYVEAFIYALIADNQIEEAQKLITEMVQAMAAIEAQHHVAQSHDTHITALLPHGRAGSMFFHSLFDGHPELLTLPGLYFKGWFSTEAWKRFAPNYDSPTWREQLVQLIVKEFQPLFDARSTQNVIGRPFGNTDWLAKKCGFMEMGPQRNQPLIIDVMVFSAYLLNMLAPLQAVDQKLCFELIHEAFENTVRGLVTFAQPAKKQIFYHIHNPNFLENTCFLSHYPKARLLYIVRNPIQNLESWIMSEMEGSIDQVNESKESNVKDKYFLSQWVKAAAKVKDMFYLLRSPFYGVTTSYGVRLEDIKRKPKEIMPKIASWMGIEDHASLYESSFCGMQYWGPASPATAQITGFDTKAIDRSVGRLFGPRDITIFETLFWPFSHLFGYTTMDEATFRTQLQEIRPWLDEPLAFETQFYAQLTHPEKPLNELSPYIKLHKLLIENWGILHRDGTYHGMLQPLELRP